MFCILWRSILSPTALAKGMRGKADITDLKTAHRGREVDVGKGALKLKPGAAHAGYHADQIT